MDRLYLVRTPDGLARVNAVGEVMWLQPEASTSERSIVQPQTNDYYVRDNGQVVHLATNTLLGEDLLSSGPILEDCSQLFSPRDPGGVNRVQANGHILWEGPSVSVVEGATDTIGVGKDNQTELITAFSLADGSVAWSKLLEGGDLSEQFLRQTTGGTIATSDDDGFHMFNPETGAVVFSKAGFERRVRACGNTLWWQNRESSDEQGLVVYDGTTGTEIFRDELVSEVFFFATQQNSASTRSADRVVLVRDGKLVLIGNCANPSAGVTVQSDLEFLFLDPGSVATDTTLFLASSRGSVYVDLETAQATPSGVDRTWNTLGATSERIVFRTQDDIIVFVDPITGEQTELLGTIFNLVAVPNHLDRPIIRVFGTRQNQVHLDASTGEVVPIDDATEPGEQATDPTPEPEEITDEDLAPGIVRIEPDDDWCTIVDKLQQNYGVLGPLPADDRNRIDLSFTQTLDSVRIASERAPADIAADMAVVFESWEALVKLHQDVAWSLADVDQAKITAVSTDNIEAFQAVEAYNSANCG